MSAPYKLPAETAVSTTSPELHLPNIESVPPGYEPVHMVQMLQRFMGSAAESAAVPARIEPSTLLYEGTAAFLDRIFEITKLLRANDALPVAVDIQAARLRLSGQTGERIYAEVFAKSPDDTVSRVSANARVRHAIDRLVDALHQRPGYQPDKIARAYPLFLAGNHEVLPLPTEPNPPQPKRRLPKAKPKPSTASADQVHLLEEYLSKADLGRELKPDHVAAISRYFLNEGSGQVDQQTAALSLAALHHVVQRAREYQRPTFITKEFNAHLEFNPENTVLFAPLLNWLEKNRASGFSRIQAANKYIPSHKLRNLVIKDLRRLLIIPTPDIPPAGTVGSTSEFTRTHGSAIPRKAKSHKHVPGVSS